LLPKKSESKKGRRLRKKKDPWGDHVAAKSGLIMKEIYLFRKKRGIKKKYYRRGCQDVNRRPTLLWRFGPVLLYFPEPVLSNWGKERGCFRQALIQAGSPKGGTTPVSEMGFLRFAKGSSHIVKGRKWRNSRSRGASVGERKPLRAPSSGKERGVRCEGRSQNKRRYSLEDKRELPS